MSRPALLPRPGCALPAARVRRGRHRLLQIAVADVDAGAGGCSCPSPRRGQLDARAPARSGGARPAYLTVEGEASPRRRGVGGELLLRRGAEAAALEWHWVGHVPRRAG